jgi:DNA phosphorothioation-dependent restriction protein DptG
MKNSSSIFIGIIAAATAGVVIGMLIAPEKGEDLRQNIKDTVNDWAKKLNNLANEGKDQLKNLKSTLSEGVDEIKNERKTPRT